MSNKRGIMEIGGASWYSCQPSSLRLALLSIWKFLVKMRGSTLLVWVCFGLSGLVALLAVVGWGIENPQFARLGEGHTPMPVQNAVLTLLLAAGLLLLVTRNDTLARVVSSATVLTAIVLLALYFKALPVSFFPASIAKFVSESLALMPLNSLLSILMLAAAQLILSYEGGSGIRNSAALVLALVSLSVCLLAVYGYMVGAEFAYWWPLSAPMAPNSALAQLSLGLGLITLTWIRFTSSSTRSSDIVLGIQMASGSVLFITVLLSSSLAMIPLYEAFLDRVYEEARKSVESKRTELSLFLSSIRTVADSIGMRSYTDASLGIVDSAQGSLLLELEAKALPGIKRVLFNPTVPQQSSTDQDSAENAWKGASGTTDSRQLKLVVTASELNQPGLTAYATVYGARGESLGILAAEIDLTFLQSLISQDVPSSTQQGSFYLLPDTTDKRAKLLKVPLSKNEAPGLAVVDAGLSELLKALSPDPAQEQAPSRAILRRDLVSFLYPLPGSNSYLAFASEVSPFRHLLNQRFIDVIIALVVLLVLSTLFVFLLMRKLGNRMLFLENRVKHSLDVVAQELTLRRDAQSQIEKSLEEKDILLKEIHHRVKNNLQVISSILNLQLRRTDKSEVATVLRDSADRIQSIALLHETLYRSANFKSINISNYMGELVKHLSESYSMRGRLAPHISSCGITLELDRAIPLGMILTELVTNSLKYGFSSQWQSSEQPSLRIDCGMRDDRFFMNYRDNGVGLPKNFVLEEMDSLGSKLITILVKQLKGEIRYSSANGAHFQVSFPYVADSKEKSYEKTASSNC
ncbi:MAG: sensor histidine kinase [Deltaproteobacteria bacterium]|nr:sensor histidine kinase [Deltaproteobacteria bacterium]